MSLKKFLGAAVLTIFSATSSFAATIDLGFSLDTSGSVGTSNFNLTRDALADALGQIPTSGPNQYRLAVTKFAGGSTTIIAPTVVTAGNIVGLQNTLRATSHTGGSTNTAGAITSLTTLFQNDGGLGNTTLLNITTDGVPNSQALAESAALAAYNAGVDGISFEAIGSGPNLEGMRRIASLGTTGVVSPTGAIVTDINNIPNAITQGFVLPVATFLDYEAAIKAKIGRVIDDTGGGTSPVPLPAGIPLLLTGLGAFGLLRVRRKTS